jgi:hypothetical protein
VAIHHCTSVLLALTVTFPAQQAESFVLKAAHCLPLDAIVVLCWVVILVRGVCPAVNWGVFCPLTAVMLCTLAGIVCGCNI